MAFSNRNGEKRWATADRNGFFYLLNREDGAFVRGVPFVKDISWARGLDENGRPIFNEANGLGNPAKATDGNTGEVVFSSLAFLGGKDRQPVAVSQLTVNFCVPSNK